MSRAEVRRVGAGKIDRPPSHRLATALGCSAICAGIFGLGAALRSFELGRLSFWYDEVVTMRLARADSVAALLERLFQIDATRAPLHPILLEAWLRLFGTSEASARSLSVVCGLATIVLIFLIGRIVFDAPTGLWAAWLGALSPILVVYSREARMYAWLVLVTCFAWLALLVLNRRARCRECEPPGEPVSEAARREPRPSGEPTAKAARTEPRPPGITRARAHSIAWTAAYGLSLVALAYSHPLGIVMGATLALAGLIGAQACFGDLVGWLVVHGVAVLLVLPWVRNYFDHAPEFLSGRPPFRFLLGVPIGFIGGDFRVLLGLVLLIAVGLWRGPLIGRATESRCPIPGRRAPVRADWRWGSGGASPAQRNGKSFREPGRSPRRDGADFLAVVVRCAADFAVSVLASFVSDIRAGAIYGVRRAGISGPGRGWLEPIAGPFSLSGGDSACGCVSTCTGAACLRPRAQSRLARFRAGYLATPARPAPRSHRGGRRFERSSSKRRGRNGALLPSRKLHRRRGG